MEGIEGQAFVTKNVRDALEPFTNAEAKTGSEDFARSEAAAMALLASGSGTLVRLDVVQFTDVAVDPEPLDASPGRQVNDLQAAPRFGDALAERPAGARQDAG